jgi:hypothetical protein
VDRLLELPESCSAFLNPPWDERDGTFPALLPSSRGASVAVRRGEWAVAPARAAWPQRLGEDGAQWPDASA